MAPKTVVTGTMRQRIRELHALGVPFSRIAKDLGISYETAMRHASDKYEARIKAYQRSRYEKERATKPEVVERRRAKAREYAAKKRAEALKKRLPREVTPEEFAKKVMVEDAVVLDHLATS